MLTQNEKWLRIFFDYGAAVFFVGMAAVEWYLAVVCCRKFSRDEPLRLAWQLISISSACRLAGLCLAHIYAVPTGLNPYSWIDPAFLGAAMAPSRRLGLSVSGPIHMMFLAAGLWQVLLVYGRVGLAAKLSWTDRMLMLIVLSFTIWQGCELVVYGSQPLTIENALNWMTDPLLSLLLIEAILLRRAALTMEGGVIVLCWGTYTNAIFVTSLGSMGIWATLHNYIPWPLNSLTWYIWFFTSAAFALAPAYQLEVIQRTHERAFPKLGRSGASLV